VSAAVEEVILVGVVTGYFRGQFQHGADVAKRLLDQVPPDVFFGEQSPATTSELKEARAIKLAAAALVGLATRHMDTASYSVPEIQFERLVQLLYPPPLRAPADGGDGDNQ